MLVFIFGFCIYSCAERCAPSSHCYADGMACSTVAYTYAKCIYTMEMSVTIKVFCRRLRRRASIEVCLVCLVLNLQDKYAVTAVCTAVQCACCVLCRIQIQIIMKSFYPCCMVCYFVLLRCKTGAEGERQTDEPITNK